MKKSNAPAVQTDTETLEFPDWSGMDESSDRMSVEAAFAMCEEYSRIFPTARQRPAHEEKCLVEFVL